MRAEETIRGFIEASTVAYLATVDNGRPRVRPMAVLAFEGDALHMIAYASSHKLLELSDNPNAELCFMDKEMNHLRLAGTIELTHDSAMKRRLWQENPYIHEYFRSPADPDMALLKMTVTDALLMDNESREYQHLEVGAAPVGK